MKLLEKWEKEGVPLLLTDGQSAAIPAGTDQRVPVPKAGGNDDNQYKSLLNQ
jgi:hypothetical protein